MADYGNVHFRQYLSARPDGSYRTEEFLEQGVEATMHRRLDEFVAAEGTVKAWTAFRNDTRSLRMRPRVLPGRPSYSVRWSGSPWIKR